MALIGTISGSNGTTTSAITGSMIIAADPGVITPTKPPGVVLFVSGAATSIGADDPSILLKGDAFISGALGTDSYIQMKPVNTLRIPTNTTASYIYTSGSTNDLYFTQYSGPYTNTTRLRWLEGMLTTGLLHGGVLSTANGSTTFSITSGSGIILSYNATLTADPYPTINYVQWPTYVSQSLTYVTSSLLTYIGINPSGGIIQQTSPFSTSTDSDYITIGRVLHQSGSVTNGTITQPIVSYGANHWQDDFTRAFGPLKVSGHVLAASGSTLSITKTAGDSYVIGRNYTTDPNNPNNITSATDTAVTVSKIYRAYVSGSTLRLDTGVANAGYTTINPTQYNNNGTLASVGAANASIQRVYWYPNSVSRAFTVYYGSDTYADPPGSGQDALDIAQQNIASENFVEGENTAGAAILVGYILVMGNATNLSDAAQARFIQAGISRGAGAGGGGGVAVGATTPGGLDTYVQFNDGGSTFDGDAGLTYNKTTDTLTVAGDIAVDGGDITTTATTFNLVNTTAATVNLGGGASAINIGAAGSAATFAGNVTGSKFTSNAAGSLVNGDGQVYLNGASSNRIDFSSQGTGDPAFNAPTAGTKVVLYPAAGASATDYAIGISPATLWQSIPAADPGMMFKWFGGTTTLAALSGSGNMEISGDLAVNGGDITTSAGTFNLVNATAATVNLGGGASAINIGAVGSATTFAGNVTGSNALLSGDLAVNGGDITSTAASLNVSAGASGVAFQLSGSPFVTFASGALGPSQLSTIQASSGKRLVLASGLGSTQVLVSGSAIDFRTSNSGSPSGIDFTNDVAGSPSSYLNITSGTYVPLVATVSTNAAKITATSSRDLVLGVPAGQKVFISGSTVTLNGGAAGISVQRDAAEILQVSSPGSPQVSIVPGSGFTTANLFNVTTTTLNVGGNATSVSLGASTGRTTVNNDLAIATGNIIGAPGAGANVMTLVSSGNIIAKLDTDNNGTGHRFSVQDWRNIDQFTVGEDGNADVSGSLVISGTTALGTTVERLLPSAGGTGVVAFDMTFNSIFYVNNPAGDITANFTSVPTTNNRVLTPTVILSQSATPRTITAVQVNGTGSSILWANNTTPTSIANKQDVFGFSLIRSGSIWTVLGQLSTYG